MKKKSFAIVLIIATMLISLAACGINKDTDAIRIGVSNCSDTDTFTKLVSDTLKDMIEEGHPEWDAMFEGAQMDSSVQITQVQDYLAQGVDFIAMSSADTAGSSPVLDECLAANVPLVNYVNPINGDESKYTYVGGDNDACGREIADYVAELIPENGTYVIIEGDPGAINGVIRRNAVEEQLSKIRPDVQLLDSQTGNWEVELSMRVTEDWLTRYGDDGIDAIIGMNDNSALGAVEALKARGLNGKVIVTGCDGTEDAWNAIAAGDITMSKFYNHVAQAEGVYKVLEELVGSEKIATNWVYTEFENVDKANVAEYLETYYK